MSRLNAGAFEFVPGKSHKAPTQPPPEPAPQPVQPSLPSLDNPGPPQTISLNIGGSKPTPPATPPLPQQSQPQKPSPPKAQTPTPKPDAAPAPATTTAKLQPPSSNATSSKVFTLEKAKTDTTAISNELIAVADQDTLKELFGDGIYFF
jgi:peptide chain release factor subunit 3